MQLKTDISEQEIKDSPKDIQYLYACFMTKTPVNYHFLKATYIKHPKYFIK